MLLNVIRSMSNSLKDQEQCVKKEIGCFILKSEVLFTRYAWLTGNERGGWTVCHIVNMIGNAQRTHTQDWMSLCPSLYTFSTHPCFSVSACFCFLHTLINCLSLFALNTPSFSLNHTRLYTHSWLFGCVAFDFRLIMRDEVCDPVRSVRNWPKEIRQGPRPPPNLEGINVRVQKRGGKVFVCTSIPIFSRMTYVESFT